MRDNGFSIDWVLEISPGISDEEVIEIAKRNKQILITEDKDFGKWVFSHQIRGLTIIFLRYEKEDYLQVMNYSITVVKDIINKNSKEDYEFVTINRNKIRKRAI